MTDYRLRLLEYLEQFQNYKGNVLSIVEEYLTEIGRTERLVFLSVILDPLVKKGYAIYPAETAGGFKMHLGGEYASDNLIVRMTDEGHDYLEELRKKKLPSPQPLIIMTQMKKPNTQS